MSRLSSRSILLLALALVTGLVLGAGGAATASGLTRGAVKKIATKAATKVLKKQSAGLSVAHAATAATATQAGSVTAYSYSLGADPTPAGGKTWTFPGLPAGTYLATYDLNAYQPTGALNCGLAGGTAVHTFGQASGNQNSVTGAGVVTFTGTLSLHCASGVDTFQLDLNAPSVATFVPVASTAGTASLAP
jgi:hypothetical protein